MRVLMGYPAFPDRRISDADLAAPPMGMIQLGAELTRAGHEVLLCDWHRAAPARVEADIRAFKPQVLGLSIVNANRAAALSAARLAKSLLPRVAVVLGGVGATMLWRLLLGYPQVDYVALGEADLSFPALLAHLEREEENPEEELRIPGIALRRGDAAVLTAPPEPVGDLSALARPWEHFTYQHLALSRGCPGACAFCGSPRFWGRKVRFRDPEDMAEEFAALHRGGVNFFYVSDDTFTMDPRRVRALCRAIISRRLNIRFAAICRAENMERETLALLRRAGCIQLSFGVESADEEVLRRLGKKVSRTDLLRAFSLCREAGILPRAYFMYGCPGDSEAVMEQNRRLMDELKPLAAIFYLLTLFPGTRLYDEWKERTGGADEIWRGPMEDLPYCRTDPDLSDERVISFGDGLRKHFFQNLPGYALSLSSPEDPESAGPYAAFLARLAMTFAFGDYAENPQVPQREQTAATLFSRSLSLSPNADAYLGLGLLLRRCGDGEGAARVLDEGKRRFPGDADLRRALDRDDTPS